MQMTEYLATEYLDDDETQYSDALYYGDNDGLAVRTDDFTVWYLYLFTDSGPALVTSEDPFNGEESRYKWMNGNADLRPLNWAYDLAKESYGRYGGH